MTVLRDIFYFILMLHVIMRYIYCSTISIHCNIRKVCNRKRIDEYKFLPVTDVSQGKLLKIAVLVFVIMKNVQARMIILNYSIRQ